ncbi:MAG: hypothetical protein ABI315_12480 [Bacteroidia bacterium]
MNKEFTFNLKLEINLEKQLFLLLFLAFNLIAYGQKRSCGTDELSEQLAKSDTTYIQRRDSLEKRTVILLDSPEFKKFLKDRAPLKKDDGETRIYEDVLFLSTNNTELVSLNDLILAHL